MPGVFTRFEPAPRARFLLVIFGLARLLAWPGAFVPAAQAAEKEGQVREFNVLVDGKERGKLRMTIRKEADGREVMNSEASVKVNYLVYNYQYTSKACEVWRDGRLQELNTVANYDGKRYSVQAQSKGNVLSVKVNGQERSARPDVWVTTYWRLPDPRLRNGQLPIIESDTGRDLRGELHYVGLGGVNIGGKVQKCAHFRVSGSVQVDLWYDAEERLVRQESIESGHRTVLELSKLQ